MKKVLKIEFPNNTDYPVVYVDSMRQLTDTIEDMETCWDDHTPDTVIIHVTVIEMDEEKYNKLEPYDG